MEDKETPRMHKHGECKTTRIMMATVRHVTSSSGLKKFQAALCFLNREYIACIVPSRRDSNYKNFTGKIPATLC
jgi:hypothetical protein